MGIFSAVAVWWNVGGAAPVPRTAAVFVTVIGSAFILLGMYLIAAYFRERLFVFEAAIRQVGCFRTRTLALEEVNRIVWRTRPAAGSVVLRAACQTMTIEFGNYSRLERTELAIFLRQRLAADRHDGWPLFVETYLEPSPQRRQATARLRRLSILLLCGFAVTFFRGLGGGSGRTLSAAGGHQCGRRAGLQRCPATAQAAFRVTAVLICQSFRESARMPVQRLCPALLLILATATASAQVFDLSEEAAGRTFLTAIDVTGEGTFEFQPPAGQTATTTHPVKLAAAYRFAERRLPAAGREARAYRALRVYRQAASRITVGERQTIPQLREERAQIVVTAGRGVTASSPDGPLTAKEIKVLASPADSLLLPALLPGGPVAVGQDWTPPDWVAAALAGVEEAFVVKLRCRLTAVDDGEAQIDLQGNVQGAIAGTTSETTLSGRLTYSLATRCISAAKLTQTEKRAVGGALSPRMSLALTAGLRRIPAPPAAVISDATAAAIPLPLPPAWQNLEYAASWGVTLVYDRDWELYQEDERTLVLRLLDRGRMIAQANLSPVEPPAGGGAVSVENFQAEIKASLGERVTGISAAQSVDAPDGRLISRLSVTGKVAEGDRLWRYYLLTAPDGRQAACTITVEPQNLEELAERDVALVRGLRFVPAGE